MVCGEVGSSLRRNAVILVALVLTGLGAGCSGAVAGGRSSGPGPDALTGDQVRQDTTAEYLYDAIRQLRPRWLRPRSQSSFTMPDSNEPVVYVNDVQYGPLDSLRQIHVNDVMTVAYMSPADATTRFGTGHGGGSIMVNVTR